MSVTVVLAALFRWLDRALLVVASAALLAMMLHISADVAGSLIWNAPIATTSAIVTQYYMIAVAFLPILAAERRGAHIGITLVTDALPRAIRRVLRAAVSVLIAGVYAMLATQAWEQALSKMAIGAYMVEQTSRIEVWPSFFVIPVAFAAIALLMAAKSLWLLLGKAPDVFDAGAERRGDV